MFKKLFFVALGLGLAGIFLFGSGFGSYVETAAGMVKEKVRGSIPLEFEIRRAEELIEGIVPEIRACKRVVAEEEVVRDPFATRPSTPPVVHPLTEDQQRVLTLLPRNSP